MGRPSEAEFDAPTQEAVLARQSYRCAGCFEQFDMSEPYAFHHIVSIRQGQEMGIAPEILSHPDNCVALHDGDPACGDRGCHLVIGHGGRPGRFDAGPRNFIKDGKKMPPLKSDKTQNAEKSLPEKANRQRGQEQSAHKDKSPAPNRGESYEIELPSGKTVQVQFASKLKPGQLPSEVELTPKQVAQLEKLPAGQKVVLDFESNLAQGRQRGQAGQRGGEVQKAQNSPTLQQQKGAQNSPTLQQQKGMKLGH